MLDTSLLPVPTNVFTHSQSVWIVTISDIEKQQQQQNVCFSIYYDKWSHNSREIDSNDSIDK